MAYQPQQPKSLAAIQLDDTRDPGLNIPTKITTSQQSVLDQLHNHVAFSESLIFLSGPSGAGKTTLLEVFLEQASDYANLAYIPSPRQIKPAALRSMLLRQLVSLDAYSTDDSLLEALQRNLKPGRQHLIICVDNGTTLASEILAELQELVSSRHLFNQEHRVSVVIAAESEWAKRASKGISLGAAEAPIVIDIPAFFKREQQWFARKLAATQGDNLDAPQRNEAQVAQWLARTDGFPGQIQAVLEDELLQRPHTEQAIQARRRRLQDEPVAPVKPNRWLSSYQLLIILVGTLALIALAIVIYSRPSTPPEVSVEAAPNTDTLTTNPVEIVQIPEALQTSNVTETVTETGVIQTPSPESVPETEPPATQANESTVVMDYEQALEKLREQSEVRPAPRDIQFQLVQPLAQAQPQEPAHTEPEADEPVNPFADMYDNLVLWNRSPERYVFQVAAFNSEARLEQFLADYSHPELRIYQTFRNQQHWYMVVVGDFDDADTARAYLDSNADLQSIQPWLKTLRLVHEDLAPVMEISAQDASN